MSSSVKFLAIASLMLTAAAVAQPPRRPIIDSSHESIGATYTPGSQYTATLDQTHNQWRLQPADGQDVLIDAGDCANGTMVPSGVWLLVLNDQGRPELLAPSVTRLPIGAADRIALRSCDQAHGRDLAVPQSVLELLAVHTGAVYVLN